jgi:ATP-binding cassette, subfamily F, member 3
MSIISTAKLNKNFGITPVLADVSFHINKNDRIGIVGANGAGKSTLLKILIKESPFDSGDLYISPEVSIGYLKQRDHFPGIEPWKRKCLLFSRGSRKRRRSFPR